MSDEDIFKSGIHIAETEKDDPFDDPKGVFPKREYANAPSVNLEARGIEQNELLIGGGDVGLDLEIKDYPASTAPLNQVRRTVSGHVQEVDDTPGRERMLFRHKTGAGVELRSDGSVIINATNNMIRVAGGSEKVIIEGDGQLVYHGNLRMKVDGDFDLDVGGNINMTSGGAMTQDIKGGFRQDVNGNHSTFVNKRMMRTITGSDTSFISGDQTNIIKRSQSTTVGTNKEDIIGSEYQISAENKYIATAPDMNMGASSLTFIGDSGTIGGENMVYYGHTAHIPRVNSTSVHATAMYATTFHGDLTGKADDANQADYASTAGQAPLGAAGSPGSNVNNTTVATNKTTVQPTNSVIKNDWFNSQYGIFKVAIDVGDVIFNSINRLVDYGGVSDRSIQTKEVRSKLRNAATQNNEEFIASALAENILHGSYTNAVPKKIGSVIDDEPTARNANPKEVFGKIKGAEAKRFAGSVQNGVVKIIPNPLFDPERKKIITKRTKLARGINIAKFLGGHGDPITIEHMADDDRVEMAKYLYLHAQMMRSIAEDDSEFDEYRLIVSEGVYKIGQQEVITPGSVNDYRSYGRAIVYELRNRQGKIAFDQTFRLAAWWKDSQQYERMILDYDTYNRDGSLNVQIIVIMPELSTFGYTANYTNKLETRYNNYVQATGELIEILG